MPDFFANDTSTEAPIRDTPEPEPECALILAARQIALECLHRDAKGWQSLPAFRTLCALAGVEGPDSPRPKGKQPASIPIGWRTLDPDEIIAPGDQWQPLRRRPSKSAPLRLPFEPIQPILHGTRRGDCKVKGLIIRPLRHGDGDRTL